MAKEKDKKKYILDKVFNVNSFFEKNTDDEVKNWIGISKEQFKLLYQAYLKRGYEWHSHIINSEAGLFIVLFFLKKNQYSIQELQEFRADATKNSGLQRAETRKKFCKSAFQNVQKFFSYIEENAATEKDLYTVIQLIPNRDRYNILFADYLGPTPTSTPSMSRSTSTESLTNNFSKFGLQSPEPNKKLASKQEAPFSAPPGNNCNNDYMPPQNRIPFVRAQSEPIKQTKKINEENDKLKYVRKRNDLNLFFKNAKQPHKDIEIEGNNLHLSLQQISNAAFNKFNTPQMQNVVVGDITFIVSDRPVSHLQSKEGEKHCLHGRKTFSFPLKFDLDERSVAITNKKFFDDVPKNELTNLLNHLNKLAKDHLGEIAERKQIAVPQNDMHSEVLLCYLLFQEQLIRFLVYQLIQKLQNQGKDFRMYGIILDLHSKNSMCPNCGLALLGLLLSNQDNGFLKKVRDILAEYGFVKTDKELRLIIRYSFDEKYQIGPKLDYIKDETKNENPEQDIKKLFEKKVILHTKEANFWSEAPEKRTGFFSGYRKGNIEEDYGEFEPTQELADQLTVKGNK